MKDRDLAWPSVDGYEPLDRLDEWSLDAWYQGSRSHAPTSEDLDGLGWSFDERGEPARSAPLRSEWPDPPAPPQPLPELPVNLHPERLCPGCGVSVEDEDGRRIYCTTCRPPKGTPRPPRSRETPPQARLPPWWPRAAPELHG